MKSVGWLLAGVAARFHVACGWLAYRFGCRRAARSHFERVLLLRGDSFLAYVNLAHLAFDVGDYAGWRRELEHARRLDPERFARLRHPLELFEPRLAGTSVDRPRSDVDFDRAGDRATWRTVRSPAPRQPMRPEALDTSLDDGLEALLPGLDSRADADLPSNNPLPDASRAHDDCATAAERARFSNLGPIARAELQRCDLDELLRRLSG